VVLERSGSSINGSSVTYAGGGGGGANGNGIRQWLLVAQVVVVMARILQTWWVLDSTAGTANTGGGGGGGSRSGSAGAAGGSGIVIVKYSIAKAIGGTITNDGTNWIHTFTSSGTFVPYENLTADYLVVAGGGGGAGLVQRWRWWCRWLCAPQLLQRVVAVL
jgi:hypothetical protein